MEKFLIRGEKHLRGEVDIKGAKNAAAPILAATLLTDQECIIDNIPLVEDVFRMIEILKSLGAKTKWLEKHKILIKNKGLSLKNLKLDLIKQLRSSVLIIGPLLARLGKITMSPPGGCLIGVRSLDTHLDAFEGLGAKIKEKGENYEFVLNKTRSQQPQTIVLKEFSVTATENILMFASANPSTTIIKLAAAEPHVQDLCQFLTKMGAEISGCGTHTIKIKGKNILKGARHTVIPDYIEAATFMIAIAATKGRVKIKNIIPDHLDAIVEKLKEMGVKIKITPGSKSDFSNLIISPATKLKAARIQTLPYPGIATDIQAAFGILATQANGMSLIHDPLFEGRLRYAAELNRMGANCLIADAHRAFIIGPTPLYGKNITSFDIRAGATLIIAGLVARGQTIIDNVYQVDRGYERIEERLKKLGADIKRISA